VKTKSLLRCGRLLACLLISGHASHLLAANMRSFIESVPRNAPVAYVGSVKEVRLLQRTKFDIKAKAVVDIMAVIRTPGSNPPEATIEYSSFDDKTPMLEGGPQYQLRPGVTVIRLCQFIRRQHSAWMSFARHTRGSCCSGLKYYAMLAKMSPDQLKVNEITEEDRRVQMSLYDKLSAYLRAAE
jgi:hypothetical protein